MDRELISANGEDGIPILHDTRVYDANGNLVTGEEAWVGLGGASAGSLWLLADTFTGNGKFFM